jgi:regulator of sigma E protease
MGSILGTMLSFGIVFGIFVFVHEFGHFFMAKLMKVKVEVFSWGYGKRLFGIKRGDTDYRVSIFPMGGYVRFSGGEVLEEGREIQPYDLLAKKRWQRFLIILMGPVMNIFLAMVFFSIINIGGVTVPEYQDQKPVIGWIESGSPAERASLKLNDEIISINNSRTKTWSDVEIAVGTKPERTITVEIIRDGEVLTKELKTEKKTRYAMGYAGFFGKILTQAYMVSPGSPAEKGGLKSGDVILEIGGEPVFFYQFVETIEKNPEKELEFLIEREGEEMTLRITPRREGSVGKIGVLQTAKSQIRKYGLFAAFGQSIKDSFRLTKLVFNSIKDLITGQASVRQIGGPLEIANISYAAFRMGFMAMISWIALISLQLGIINLFPIPVLDGGHLLVLALESLFRRDFSIKVKQIIMQIGFVILIILIVFIILNDITKRLPNGWDSLIPW